MADPKPPSAADDAAPPDPVIHIGFPKTATTFLQRRVFPRHPGIAVVGRPDPTYDADGAELRHALLRAEDAAFARACGKLRSELDAFRTHHAARVTVLSDEHISTGCLTSPFAEHPPATILERLGVLWPCARILVGLRRQPAILYAEYQNQLRLCRTRADADAWLDGLKDQPRPNILDAFDFHRRLAQASEVFGADRVHVLFYEDLQDDPARFLGALAHVIRVPRADLAQALETAPVNATSPLERAYLDLRRRMPGALRRNPLIRPARRLVNLDRVRALGQRWRVGKGSARGGFHPRNEQFLNDFYAESNEMLERWVGTDLAQLGYPVARRPASCSRERSTVRRGQP